MQILQIMSDQVRGPDRGAAQHPPDLLPGHPPGDRPRRLPAGQAGAAGHRHRPHVPLNPRTTGQLLSKGEDNNFDLLM